MDLGGGLLLTTAFEHGASVVFGATASVAHYLWARRRLSGGGMDAGPDIGQSRMRSAGGAGLRDGSIALAGHIAMHGASGTGAIAKRRERRALGGQTVSAHLNGTLRTTHYAP